MKAARRPRDVHGPTELLLPLPCGASAGPGVCWSGGLLVLSLAGGAAVRDWEEPVQWPSTTLSPAVMFSTPRSWDTGHAPCLQELWKRDVSLDASSVDFLMSDEDSFLSLPPTAFTQRHRLSSQGHQSNTPSQDLLLQTVQNRVAELHTRLHSEDVTHHLLLQQLRTRGEGAGGEEGAGGGEGGAGEGGRAGRGEGGAGEGGAEGGGGVLKLQQPSANGSRTFKHTKHSNHFRGVEEQLVTQLHTQVAELEEKLLDQKVERRHSELGATDLEKQLELLLVENQRLKQEVKSCRRSEILHGEEAEPLCREAAPQQTQAQLKEWRLADVELEEKSCRVEESRRRQVEYVTQTAEVESADAHQTTCELQVKNGVLQEQLMAQGALLRELEMQLHESQRSCTQLRTQILVYQGEMERAQGQLEAEMQNLEEEKNRVIEEAFIRAESEMKAVHQNLAGVRMNLLSLQPALRTLTCDYNSLKKQVQEFPFMLEKAISEAKQEICQVITEVSSTNQELLAKYKREMNLRKKCHNELVRLKGNIRVLCRVRPVSQEEQDSVETGTTLSFDSDDDAVLYLTGKGKVMTFELDRVFPPQASQEEVFREVRSLVTSCIDGFNVCIFAYGQTGSGKTYTMEGVAEDPGINQRALRLLFSEVTDKSADWDHKISVSMVEIYNETLRDLLGDRPSDRLDIKMNPDGSGHLYVPGLTEVKVQSPDDINRVFEVGHMTRATACTNLNEHSSRSHALLIITVTGVNLSTGSRTQGKLNLVDLAGSERIGRSGAEGSRLREAQCINKSLSALGDVINALRARHAHIPFRNSRLTYLLQDSLSGDSKTLMMVQVSPSPGNLSESVCSLKFAQRVRSVDLAGASSKRHDNSSTSSSPTHDSAELDSPPATPLPLSRASSAGSALSSASRTPSSTRRRSQSQLAAGRLKMVA